MFKKNVETFYAHWAAIASDMDALVVSTYDFSPSGRQPSATFFQWLTDHELPQTTAIFTASTIHFVCDYEEAEFLRCVTSTTAVDADCRTVVVQRSGELRTPKQGRSVDRGVLGTVLVRLRSAKAGRGPLIGFLEGAGFGSEKTQSIKNQFKGVLWKDCSVFLNRFLRGGNETATAKIVSGPDECLFMKNLIRFNAHWTHGGGDWKEIQAMVITPSPVSNTFLRWLVGSDLPGTTAIFTSSGVHFICQPDQAAFIRGLRSSVSNAVYNIVVVHRKVKAVTDAQQTRVMEDVVLGDVLVGLQSAAAEGELKSISVVCVGEDGTETRSSVRDMKIIRRDVEDALSKFLEEMKIAGEQTEVLCRPYETFR